MQFFFIIILWVICAALWTTLTCMKSAIQIKFDRLFSWTTQRPCCLAHAVSCNWCLEAHCDWQLFLSGQVLLPKKGGKSICRWPLLCQNKMLVNLVIGDSQLVYSCLSLCRLQSLHSWLIPASHQHLCALLRTVCGLFLDTDLYMVGISPAVHSPSDMQILSLNNVCLKIKLVKVALTLLVCCFYLVLLVILLSQIFWSCTAFIMILLGEVNRLIASLVNHEVLWAHFIVLLWYPFICHEGLMVCRSAHLPKAAPSDFTLCPSRKVKVISHITRCSDCLAATCIFSHLW